MTSRRRNRRRVRFARPSTQRSIPSWPKPRRSKAKKSKAKKPSRRKAKPIEEERRKPPSAVAAKKAARPRRRSKKKSKRQEIGQSGGQEGRPQEGRAEEEADRGRRRLRRQQRKFDKDQAAFVKKNKAKIPRWARKPKRRWTVRKAIACAPPNRKTDEPLPRSFERLGCLFFLGQNAKRRALPTLLGNGRGIVFRTVTSFPLFRLRSPERSHWCSSAGPSGSGPSSKIWPRWPPHLAQ